MKNIKYIIFDLGNVILNINYQKATDEFKKLGIKNAGHFYSKKSQENLFNLFEKGEISHEYFISKIQEKTNNANKKSIITAWNSMILDLPKKRIQLLESLKKKYKLFLLSNTNIIHIRKFIKDIGDQQYNAFYNLFDHVYYSYEIKYRKPEKKAFQIILNDYDMNPQEILFIDDSIQHIRTAKKIGIICYHLRDGEDIINLFPDIIQ